MKVTWLGHSSSLVQMGENNIFIDPVLSERSSPVSFAGPKRFSDIALDAENVPDIDVMFISHDHYDHLDYDTIKAIDIISQVTIAVKHSCVFNISICNLRITVI